MTTDRIILDPEPAMVLRASALAETLGPLQQANDDTPLAIACAWANAHLLRDGWCQCAEPLDPCYYSRPDGSHGYLCSRCRRVTQTG